MNAIFVMKYTTFDGKEAGKKRNKYKNKTKMTDEVMPQMAIQLIVVVVKMISVKCAFLPALKIVYLLTLFFFASSILLHGQQCCRPAC